MDESYHEKILIPAIIAITIGNDVNKLKYLHPNLLHTCDVIILRNLIIPLMPKHIPLTV